MTNSYFHTKSNFSLQNQLNDYRDNPKATYRHNDQLEELRNLQDKLQDEKTNWSKTREEQEQKLEEQHKAQKLLQVYDQVTFYP